MENVEIANVFETVADLLEIQDANPFRVRAYRNAVRTISNLSRPLTQMVASGEDLTELPGIGEDISKYIAELVDTGRLGLLDELEGQVPPTLVDLMKIEGLGPKRARALYDKLGITSVEELEQACADGRVEALEGFGQRTVEKIQRAAQDLKKRGARFKLCDADQFVVPLLEYMRKAPAVERVEAAGSYRRRLETVGDIDLLAICPKPRPAMEHFTRYPDAERVDMAGSTRGTIILRSGLQVDLRILPRKSYGAALHYFTGSKAHNIAVRRLGVEKGLRISEYGVFRVRDRGDRRRRSAGDGKAVQIGGEKEDDVFDAVGMVWVPPELREDRGEVQAGLEGRLPDLISLDDLRGDLQMHSTWTDGHNSIQEMARACKDRGYEYMAITDHSRAVTVARGLDPERLEKQWQEIDQVRRSVRGIRILRGLEVDILRDGRLDLPDDYLRRLDLVVASVHSHMNLDRDAMTRRVIRAISRPGVHILGHPTGRIINRRNPVQIDIEAILDVAAEHDVAVELNAQPDRLDLDDVYVRRAAELGAKVAINTDAHSVETLRFMSYGVDQARRGWLEPRHVVNTWPWRELEKWLRSRREA